MRNTKTGNDNENLYVRGALKSTYVINGKNIFIGWVALHEAASRGYVDSVVTLLSLNAPLKPRTNLNELPVDLAWKNGHQECAEILSEYSAIHA